MEIIKKVPIQERKEFMFDGGVIRFKYKNEETNYYLYERFNASGRLMGYEIVTPPKHKQPDGTIIEVYPNTDKFGKYGWFLPANTPKDKIDYYMEGRHRQQPYYEFKKTL